MWQKVLVFIQNQTTTQLQQSTMHMFHDSTGHWAAAVVLSVCNVPASSSSEEEDLPCGSALTFILTEVCNN